MRRPVPLLSSAVALTVVLLGAVACSGDPAPDASRESPTSTALTSPNVFSPAATSTPPPVTPPQDAARASAESASAASVAALDLPDCLIGTWPAPLDREFDNLDVADRSAGLIRGGTGTLALTFARDRTWTLDYRQVHLDLVAGAVDVSGPVTGTWSLDGDALDANVTGSSVSAHTAPGGVDASDAVDAVLRRVPPDHAFVRCTGDGVEFQLPTSRGGGTATFGTGR